MSRLIPAVGYARRSTDKQEKSIEQQIEAVTKYADDRGYKILRWYVDDAISGDDTKNRHDFLRMISDASAFGDFETVLCWDQTRFGRFDSIEYGYHAHQLRVAGVGLATVMEGVIDWNDATGRIVGNVKQEGKHQQLIDLSGNVTRGQLEAMKAGSWVGMSPYGYQIVGGNKNKKLVLGDASHVRIVQRIFREYADDGRSMNAIAGRLNAEGYPAPRGRGKPWRSDAVRSILENPAYTGDFAASKFHYGKYHTIKQGAVVKAGKPVRKPESEWIIHRDHHEPIIDRPLFDKAAVMLAKGKTGRSGYTPENNPYLFTGLLRCGRCGCGMWMGKHNRYECGNRKENGPAICAGSYVGEPEVMRSIAEHLHREFLILDGVALASKADRRALKPADLPKAFAKVKKLVAPPKPAIDRKRIEKLARDLAGQIDKAVGNLVLLDAENIPAAQERIKKLREEQSELRAELHKHPATEADVNAEALEVLQCLLWLRFLFLSAAQEHGRDPDHVEDWVDLVAEGGGIMTGAAHSPLVRRYLRRIEAITVHTRISGRGTRTRHVLEGGEINLGPVGGVAGDLNLRRLGQSQVAYR